MRCPVCTSEVDDSANFCSACGAVVGSAARPDRRTLIDQYVPSEVKQRLLDSGQQLESERRIVTVVFADVSGYTSLSEQLDPEIVTRTINALFHGLIEIVSKNEGLIVDFFGDGILCIFGAPLAHEDDPERAIRSSLAMLEFVAAFNDRQTIALPKPLNLHIGIHTGLVVAGNVGSDLRMSYSVVGDTVNLCSRIANIATAGEIYISNETYHRISHMVEVRGPKSKKVKGKAEPLQVYQLLGLLPEDQRRKTAGQRPIIGRKDERSRLSEYLERVQSGGQACVLIQGEPGIGKSRLKDDLVERAETIGIKVWEGVCESHQWTTPYFLWSSLLRSILDLPAEASQEVAHSRLEKELVRLGLKAEQPYLGAMLSMVTDEVALENSGSRQAHIHQSVQRYLAAKCAENPALIVLEDLHWIDNSSHELLREMLQQGAVPGSLMLGLYRPEYAERAQDLSPDDTLNLSRFSRETARAMIEDRLSVGEVPDTLVDVVAARSGGNPFFVEEILQSMRETGAIEIKGGRVSLVNENLVANLPDSVHAIILSRIDRLEQRIREVLLNASVVGRNFSQSILERLVDEKHQIEPGLDHLRGLEFILRQEEVHEFEYLFKHYLIQEVAYDTLLLEKRKKLHLLIAESIEKLYGDHLAKYYELLAYHFEKAEVWDKAATYLSLAGRKSDELFTESDTAGFVARKEIAVDKLYETGGAKSKFLELVEWILAGIAGLMAVLFAVSALYAVYEVFSEIRYYGNWYIYLYFISTDKEHLYSLLILVFAIVILFSSAIFMLIIIKTIKREKPRLYDVTDQQIRIHYYSGKMVALNFCDIDRLGYVDNIQRKNRPWKVKLIDPFFLVDNYNDYSYKGIFYQALRNTYYATEYSPKQGEIRIQMNKGRMYVDLLLRPENARHLVLGPSNPRLYYDHIRLAFEKWKKLAAAVSS